MESERGSESERGMYLRRRIESERPKEYCVRGDGRNRLNERRERERDRRGREIGKAGRRTRSWPEVTVFPETLSQFLPTGAMSSVTGRTGDWERKGALHTGTVEPGWRATPR